MMTEEITNIQTYLPIKRPVGRPRKSNIPPPQKPPTTLEEYVEARNAYARDYYHAHKKTPAKERCKFVSLVGRQCPRTTNREYCSKHVQKSTCIFIDDEGKQCPHMTTRAFCRNHAK